MTSLELNKIKDFPKSGLSILGNCSTVSWGLDGIFYSNSDFFVVNLIFDSLSV